MISLLTWYGFIGITSFIGLYLLYIAVMKLKDNREHLPDAVQWVLYLVFAVGYLGDILWRVFYGSLIFWNLPKPTVKEGVARFLYELTLTYQLTQIRKGNTNIKEGSWRMELANSICLKLLNPYDQDHC